MATDSIEHYVHCPCIRDWLHRRLGVDASSFGLARWMLAEPLDDRELSVQAVAIYILNKTVHHVRRKCFANDMSRLEYVQHFFNQQLHEALKGHRSLGARILSAPPAQESRKRALPTTYRSVGRRRRTA